MSELRVEGVRREFGRTVALDGMSFDVADGEFFCLLGPSSSGKTTTLRSIAGLEQLSGGRVWFAGRDVTEATVQGRGMSMIFQTFALYPHMTVRENLSHPLERAGEAAGKIRKRVEDVAELLRVTHTLDRKTTTLSGGEQQRVAIGRAIVRQPRLLLLDEPLTNLDAKLRHDMRSEFKRLHRELGLTMLYATPDQLEALTMGQRVGVIRDGKAVAIGAPRELYEKPADLYVAQMVGSPPMNLLETTGSAPGQVDLPFLPAPLAAAGVSPGQKVTLGLRPHDLALAGGGASQAARFNATIHLTEPLGDVTILDVGTDDASLKMVLREEIAARFAVGQSIEIAFNPDDIHVFDGRTGARLGDAVAA